jgi:hypothetical protein
MYNIEDYFKYFLQRDIVISVDSKIIKEGKLILFNQKDYYLNFNLKNNNQEQKKFEIPYPFSVKFEHNYLTLSYELNSISKSDPELFYKLVSLNKKSNSRYYNTKILIFEKNKLDLSII